MFRRLRHVRQAGRDTLPATGSSQPDTQVEPDIAISPLDQDIAVAVVQQGRFPDGGSVDPGYSTTHNGGATWHHGNLPGLTTAVGGPFERASDPSVAFGPDGAVYAETLPFDASGCRNGVAVQRSDDGGRTFGLPVFIQDDTSCDFFNDKNWITVDLNKGSPHYGRIYAMWDRFDGSGATPTQPQVLRYSDDRGNTWSPLIVASPAISGTIGAQPVVQPNGDLTDVFIDFTGQNALMVSQTSHNGGLTFDPEVVIGLDLATEAPDMRTGGLPSATVDPRTGTLYAVWQDGRFRSDGLSDIVLSSSTDGGRHWSAIRKVNLDPQSEMRDHFTPDVAAFNHGVFVTYRTRSFRGGPSNLVDERLIKSAVDGATFAGERVLGPPADLRFSAFAPVHFLGDYMGVAVQGRAMYAVWCRSSTPPVAEPTHQTTWVAAFSA